MRRLTMIVLPLLIAHHLQRLSLLTAGVSGKQQFDESREIVKIAEVVGKHLANIRVRKRKVGSNGKKQ